MSRFISWLAVGTAAAFLVVVSVSFLSAATAWLAFAIGIGTLFTSAGVAYRYRGDVGSLFLGLVSAAISAWTGAQPRERVPARSRRLANDGAGAGRQLAAPRATPRSNPRGTGEPSR